MSFKVNRNEVISLISFVILGLIVNYFPIEVVYGVHFVFGSTFTYFYILKYKNYYAVPIALLTNIPTIALWGHWYALLIFVVEAIFLTWRIRNTKKSMTFLTIELIFWAFIGTPMAIIAYGLILQLDFRDTLIIITKQIINGVASLLIAAWLYTFVEYLKYKYVKKQRYLEKMQWLSQLVFATIITITAFVMIIQINDYSTNTMNQSTMADLEKQLNFAANNIDETLDDLEMQLSEIPLGDSNDEQLVRDYYYKYIVSLNQYIKKIYKIDRTNYSIWWDSGVKEVPAIFNLSEHTVHENHGVMKYDNKLYYISNDLSHTIEIDENYFYEHSGLIKNSSDVLFEIRNLDGEVLLTNLPSDESDLFTLVKIFDQEYQNAEIETDIEIKKVDYFYKKGSINIKDSRVQTLTMWLSISDYRESVKTEVSIIFLIMLIIIYLTCLIAPFLTSKITTTMLDLSELAEQLAVNIKNIGTTSTKWPDANSFESNLLVSKIKYLYDEFSLELKVKQLRNDKMKVFQQAIIDLNELTHADTEKFYEKATKVIIDYLNADEVNIFLLNKETNQFNRVYRRNAQGEAAHIIEIDSIHKENDIFAMVEENGIYEVEGRLYVVEGTVDVEDEGVDQEQKHLIISCTSNEGVIGIFLISKLGKSEDWNYDLKSFALAISVILTHEIVSEEVERIQRQKQKEELEFGRLMEGANAPIFGTDKDGYVNEWNKKAAAITGFTKAEVMGKHLVDEYIADDYKKNVQEVLDKVLKGEDISNFEFLIYSKEMKRIDVLLNFTARRDTENNIRGVFGVGQDITERKKVQAQILHTSKLEAIGEMSASMAHELNQPLNVIRMACDNLLRRLDKKGFVENSDLKKKLERIASQTVRASAIINYVRDTVRLDNHFLEIINPIQIIESSLDIMREQLKLNNITVLKEYTIEDAMIEANKIQLEQVLINLISNAKDAFLKTNHSNDRNIIFRVNEFKGIIRIEVEDTAGGINDKVIKNIFKPFFTTKEIGKGTGLGLSISATIIEGFGGTINVKNVNQGLLFVIELPLFK